MLIMNVSLKFKTKKHRLIVVSENHIKSFDEYPYKV